jgi:3,4-dihydroxy-2-butanone 4-phosphate synthase
MSGSVDTAALELRMGGMAIVGDERGGTLVLGALFATGRVIEFIAREAQGPVCLALPTPTGGVRVEPLSVAGTLPELDQRAGEVRSVAEALAAGRRLDSPRVLPEDAVADEPLVTLERLDASLRLAALAGLSGAALICPIRRETGAPAGPAALASFGRRHDVPAVAAADVLAYGPRRVQPRSARPRRRVVTRAGSYARRLLGTPAAEQPALSRASGRAA